MKVSCRPCRKNNKYEVEFKNKHGKYSLITPFDIIDENGFQEPLFDMLIDFLSMKLNYKNRRSSVEGWNATEETCSKLYKDLVDKFGLILEE